jgi:hypothetical protein
MQSASRAPPPKDFHSQLLPLLRKEEGFLTAQEVLPFRGLFIGGSTAARTPSILSRVSGILAANGEPPSPLVTSAPGSAVRRTLTLPLDDTTEQDLFAHLRVAHDFIATELIAARYGDAAASVAAGWASSVTGGPWDSGSAGAGAGEGAGAGAGASLAPGGVLVHCTLGISRSASMVCAYMMIAARITLADALTLLRRARKWVRPNDGFLAQLLQLERIVCGPAREPALEVSADDLRIIRSASEDKEIDRRGWPESMDALWSIPTHFSRWQRQSQQQIQREKKRDKGAAPPAAVSGTSVLPHKPDCPLCRLAPTTRWYPEDCTASSSSSSSPTPIVASHPAFVVIDCDTCDDAPMAVLRWHARSWEDAERVHPTIRADMRRALVDAVALRARERAVASHSSASPSSSPSTPSSEATEALLERAGKQTWVNTARQRIDSVRDWLRSTFSRVSFVPDERYSPQDPVTLSLLQEGGFEPQRTGAVWARGQQAIRWLMRLGPLGDTVVTLEILPGAPSKPVSVRASVNSAKMGGPKTVLSQHGEILFPVPGAALAPVPGLPAIAGIYLVLGVRTPAPGTFVVTACVRAGLDVPLLPLPRLTVDFPSPAKEVLRYRTADARETGVQVVMDATRDSAIGAGAGSGSGAGGAASVPSAPVAALTSASHSPPRTVPDSGAAPELQSRVGGDKYFRDDEGSVWFIDEVQRSVKDHAHAHARRLFGAAALSPSSQLLRPRL